MHTAYLVVTLVAIAFNGFSGVSALLHFAPIIPGMQAAGVPLSWLTFPIGTLKTLGTLGLIVGLWIPAIGLAAAAGLIIFFVCAMYTHVLANDISPQFGLAAFLLALNSATFALILLTHAEALTQST
ncbi:MAG: hypothetical protein QOJ56_1498 [Mycobacterium sp.]|jgi:hypothetical protein|uniref:DoxX family protein n=1 Tax=Mycobacterium sp. TaxID=1785 RepID=UPI0028BCDB64|nr:hypothetical protein [Mycobacterium sp.]MDT5352966.1 hypothetical protein [Mycobacterium sp.]MDT7760851.1 hypothetical protein [Mycobacterium sp.]